MAELNWTERLRRKLIHKLGGVLMDEVQPRPVAAAESYTTEELTCSYLWRIKRNADAGQSYTYCWHC